MPKNTKTGKVGKERLDKYYHLAKEQGYRSRAAFKLIQLNKKYDFLSSAKAVVDLCAAPGGWLQVARKYQPMAGLTVGVDLANIKSIPGVTTFVGDITTQKCLTRIRQELGGLKADVVMHDGSPNVGANWFKDAYTQAELVLHALKLAAHCLRPGGFFVSKVFRSKDYTSIVWVHNQFFEKVEATKPKASRHTSAEIYLVCSGYKAPKEIDPKLFNPTYVFEDISENKTLRSLAPKELAKRANRNREGYEDDLFLLFKRFSVAEFVESQKPISILAEYNELHFDEKSQKYFTHPDTSDEIKRLCADLKVLGMADMKAVLKWREKMAKFNDGQEMTEDDDEEEAEETTTTKAPAAPEDESEVDIQKLKKELEDLRNKTERVKKNLVKRQKIKVAKRMPLPSDMTERKDDILDNVGDAMLFSLSGVTTKEALAQAVSEEAAEDFDEDAEEQAALAEEAAKNKGRKGAVSLEFDDDEDEEEKYDQLVEQGIESLYKQYLQRKTRKEKKLLKLLESRERAKADDLNEELHEQKKFEYQATSNPLLVEFDQKKTPAERKAQQWFSQNVFDVLKNVDEENKPKKRKADDKPLAKRQRTESGKVARGNESDDSDSDDHDNSDNDAEDSDDEDYQALKKKMAASTIGEGAAAGGSGEGDIEFIPKELHDEDTRATSLALATKLLQKKARRDFVDSAFSRWAFNEDNLPDWLSEEEKKAYEKQLPITKEEVEKIKAKYKELNDRPVKKVLEAIYRKKKRVQLKMEKVREKANTIAESQDLSNQDKALQLKKLYKDAQASVKPRKVYVVARKFKAGRAGGKMAGGSVVKYVDSRMKKEKQKAKREAKKRKRGA